MMFFWSPFGQKQVGLHIDVKDLPGTVVYRQRLGGRRGATIYLGPCFAWIGY